MRIRATAFLLALLLTGCNDSTTSAETAASDVSYSITKDESLGTIKRTVEVQIEAPADEEALERLAHKIKDSRKTSYERTFIGWRIAGQTGPYYATTHFNPDLSVVITKPLD